MSAADVARTIQLIIAPVVLITACAIIQNGLLGWYSGLSQRMRSLAHERLDLLRAKQPTDDLWLERVQEIDRQIPLLIRRHRLLQNASLSIYTAIAILMFSMFAIAIAVATNSGENATSALILFIVGTGFLFLGIFLTCLEIRMSHQAICYEVNRIISLSYMQTKQ